MHFLMFLLLCAAGLLVFGLVIAFVLVPVVRGLAWLVTKLFQGVGWLVMHVFEYVAGTIGDVLRLVGSLLVMIVLLPFAPLNVIVGRWSAAGHYAESLKREVKVFAMCVYRIVLGRPLKLVMLHGILEGLEQRLPEAMAGAPTSDAPRKKRASAFDGYTIVGSLPGGGSGAKLYVAKPDEAKARRVAGMPERVVIKSFTLSEGSSLPQIVRESRALECAKQLGHVLDHGMDEHRFFYVMPYHPGEHLGVITRQLHGVAGGRGLDDRGVRTVMSYMDDLLQTLAHYHHGGLWHKDVKPENVIVHDGRAHLVDLGLVTPLRSAMTLTTHGTEYFRDPEMVRQALRGVKVHQVDGAKFDVYAVGAVLYFMLENTFPAHGGLSSFSKRSPEALRWIVRRAMADYNKRYQSADEMLADLRSVLCARDLAAVRPADLPSVRGEGVGEMGPAPAAARVASAGTPVPPAPAWASAADEPSSPAAAASPSIRVTNWWTGEYAVDGENAPVDAQAFRAESRAFRRESQDIRRRVRQGTMSARRAAREQIKTARARAKELRRRAKAHRPRSVAERQPSLALVGVVAVFLALVGLAVFGLVMASSSSSRTIIVHSTQSSGQAAAAAEASARRVPLLLVVDAPDRHAPEVMRWTKRIMSAHRAEGRDVYLPGDDRENDRFAALVRDWRRSDGDGPLNAAIAQLVADLDVHGLVYVRADDDGKLREEIIRPKSTLPATVAGSACTLLLINDHPAKNDDAVSAEVRRIVNDYARRGCLVLVDDEAEASVRPMLPPRPSGSGETEISVRAHRRLNELGLGGLVWITASAAEREGGQRIVHERIDAVPSTDATVGSAASDVNAATELEQRVDVDVAGLATITVSFSG